MFDLDKAINLITRYAFIIGILWSGLWFLAFYPTTHVSIDELEYQVNAQRLLEGTLKQECDSSTPGQFDTDKGYCVSKYNIGTSLFLIPAAYNFQLTAAPIFLMFVLGSFGFYKLLQLMQWPSWMILFYTWYPVFSYYSRTRFSEIISVALMTWILYFGIKLYQDKLSKLEQVVLACIIGLAVFTRYTNILPIGIFGIGLAVQLLRRYQSNILTTLKKIFPVLISLIPWAIVFMLFNTWLYGGALRSGYYFSEEEGLYVISQVPQMLLLFSTALLILYPGMLLGIFSKSTLLKLPIITAVVATIVFYAGFPYNFFEGRPLDLIVGIRFLVPITPFLLFGYLSMAKLVGDKLPYRRWFKVLAIALLGTAFVSVPIVHYLHSLFLTTASVIS